MNKKFFNKDGNGCFWRVNITRHFKWHLCVFFNLHTFNIINICIELDISFVRNSNKKSDFNAHEIGINKTEKKILFSVDE